MWVGAGDSRASGNVWDMRRCRSAGGGGLLGLFRRRQAAVLVALGQNLDGEVRAVALAQAAPDAVGGLDDGVVGQDEAVLGTDLDADIAALAPLIDPTDVDEIDDGGRAVYSSFGGLDGSDGRISRVSTAVRGSAGPVSLRNWAARRRCGADPARGMRRD